MKWRVPDGWMFTTYALPLFCFPLSTAGAGISTGLLLVSYAVSGHWREWRRAGERPWAIPLALLMGWTLLGLLWTSNMAFGIKVAEATSYGMFAFIGATLPWKERWLKLLIRMFIAGALINEALAFLMTWHVLPWRNEDGIAYTGFADHIFISLVIIHVFLWMLWDFKYGWNFNKWVNGLIALAFFAQLILAPGRSGQVLFVLLLPVAVWILYEGRWRYWISLSIAGLATGMLFIPSVHALFALGIHQLTHFNLHAADTNSSWGLRLIAMIGGVKMFLAHPLFGVGTGDFYPSILAMQASHTLPATPLFVMNTAANSYISEAAVLGVVGLGLFLWFLWALTREAWRSRTRPQGWFALTYISIYLVGGLFDGLSWGYADAITIALMAGLPLYQKSVIEPSDLSPPF